MKSAFKNPLTIYLSFLVNWWQNKLKHKNFYQGYMARVYDSDLEPNIKVYDYSILKDAKIGAYTYININTELASGTSVGRFCSIGPNCRIGLGKHPSQTFVSSHPSFFSTREQAFQTFADRDYFEELESIRIGNDVWIGANVLILDGVTIGDGAIIGAGAVVTKDVLPYTIVGGVPAKLIRSRFDEATIHFLLDFKWWDKDEAWLKKHFKDFHSIDEFLQLHRSDFVNR
jgi:acetyltransferase-like isoleucine patch superfamily enzyme